MGERKYISGLCAARLGCCFYFCFCCCTCISIRSHLHNHSLFCSINSSLSPRSDERLPPYASYFCASHRQAVVLIRVLADLCSVSVSVAVSVLELTITISVPAVLRRHRSY
ncbi:hypothetical protein V1521DRAFT_219785 [Lipomyces starkeyi]